MFSAKRLGVCVFSALLRFADASTTGSFVVGSGGGVVVGGGGGVFLSCR